LRDGRVLRTVLGVIAGYATNAILVGVAEAIYGRLLGQNSYLIADLITQTLATVLGAYLGCRIAREGKGMAAASMMVLGVLIGTLSLVTSWKVEPHWYGIVLLASYAPCVWGGYVLVRR
jgi:phosphotransferase system  glucose/maltose/N-acetylglucosamine-specific IIC component